MAPQEFIIYFLWSIKFVLTNYLQLLLYISQEQSDLYMLVTTVKGLTFSNYQVKVNMSIVQLMASSIKLEVIIICNCASPHGSIYYIVAFKVHVWCTEVLWAYGMQSEYMFVCSTHHQGLVSLLQQCRPYDLKGIESDSHSSIHITFVLIIINAMMNLKQFGLLVLICAETNWPGS